MNCSIFLIDGIIRLSNVMIRAVNIDGAATGIWGVFTDIMTQPSIYSLPAMLIMVVFLIFSVILIIYYLGRLIELYVGAVLSPIVLLCWLIPGMRDISETLAKTYIMIIFVLFIHVTILEIAGSLLLSLSVGNAQPDPGGFMSMFTGLAAIIALLKTQGFMTQLAYAGSGMQSSRKIVTQFVKLSWNTASKAYRMNSVAREKINTKEVSKNNGQVKSDKPPGNASSSSRITHRTTNVTAKDLGKTTERPKTVANKLEKKD